MRSTIALAMIRFPDRGKIRENMKVTGVVKRDGYGAISYWSQIDGAQTNIIWLGKRAPKIETLHFDFWRFEMSHFAELHGLPKFWEVFLYDGLKARVTGYSEDAKRVEIAFTNREGVWTVVFVDPSDLCKIHCENND